MLRDDLQDLFYTLFSYHKKKAEYLSEINTNIIKLRFLISSKREEELYVLIQKNNEIFVNMDSLEFDIKALTEKICLISGIENENFKTFFYNRKEDPIPNLKKQINNNDALMSKLITDWNKLIEDMEKSLGELKKDIATISRIQKININ